MCLAFTAISNTGTVSKHLLSISILSHRGSVRDCGLVPVCGRHCEFLWTTGPTESFAILRLCILQHHKQDAKGKNSSLESLQ